MKRNTIKKYPLPPIVCARAYVCVRASSLTYQILQRRHSPSLRHWSLRHNLCGEGCGVGLRTSLPQEVNSEPAEGPTQ